MHMIDYFTKYLLFACDNNVDCAKPHEQTSNLFRLYLYSSQQKKIKLLSRNRVYSRLSCDPFSLTSRFLRLITGAWKAFWVRASARDRLSTCENVALEKGPWLRFSLHLPPPPPSERSCLTFCWCRNFRDSIFNHASILAARCLDALI